jgi:putative toxin-antitoxin system antitoxin component (TIGR02293 family)
MTAIQAHAKGSPFRVGGTLALDHLHQLGSKSGLRAVDLLGGSRVFGGKVRKLANFDPLLWDAEIAGGLPLKALDALLEVFHVAQKPLLESIGVNVRSLQRQRKSANATLDPDSAARAVALAHLVEQAIDVMGSSEAADQWLSTPNQELAGRPMGNRATIDVLNSIYHGMFSG